MEIVFISLDFCFCLAVVIFSFFMITGNRVIYCRKSTRIIRRKDFIIASCFFPLFIVVQTMEISEKLGITILLGMFLASVLHSDYFPTGCIVFFLIVLFGGAVIDNPLIAEKIKEHISKVSIFLGTWYIWLVFRAGRGILITRQ